MRQKLRAIAPQLLRRFLQLSAVGFVVYAALIGAWRNYKIAHNNPRIVGLLDGELIAGLYALNERFLSLFGDSARTSLDFLGFPWSATFFGLEVTDPILAASHTLSTGEISTPLLAGAAIPVALALISGKLFCSHLCPMRLLFEIGQFVRAGMERFGLMLPDWRTEVRLGGWMLLGGLVAAVFAGPIVWLFLLPYVSFSAGIFILLSTGVASTLLAVVAFWLAVDILVAPSFFCHNLCPAGFALEKMGSLRPFRLRTLADTPPCPTGCSKCERTCPYGYTSKDANQEPGCDNCGSCALSCPMDKLGRRFGPLSAVLLALAIAVPLGVPSSAQAHHNKGLPHYGYFENYPQVPTEDYVVIDGRWEMGAVIFNFQGYDDREGSDTPNDVKIYAYLYDLEADRNYTEAVDFEIRKDGEIIAEYLRAEVDEEATYSTRQTLPESGTYELVAKLGGEPVREVAVPFEVDLNDGVNTWLIVGLGAPVVFIFVLALAGRGSSRRGRRRKGAKQ